MTTATVDAMRTLGQVTPDTRAKCLEILTAARAAGHTITVVWGAGGGAEHGSGRALDLMTFRDKAAGDWIAAYLWTHRARLGLRHYIWQQAIRSTVVHPGVIRPMEDRGNSTKNHRDHVHVWFDTSPAYRPPATSTSTPAPAPKPPAPKPPAKVPTLGTLRRQLRRGMSGPDVTRLQRALRITADGSYGPKTEAAVRAFQRRYWPHERAEHDGIVGPRTARALHFTWAG